MCGGRVSARGKVPTGGLLLKKGGLPSRRRRGLGWRGGLERGSFLPLFFLLSVEGALCDLDKCRGCETERGEGRSVVGCL